MLHIPTASLIAQSHKAIAAPNSPASPTTANSPVFAVGTAYPELVLVLVLVPSLEVVCPFPVASSQVEVHIQGMPIWLGPHVQLRPKLEPSTLLLPGHFFPLHVQLPSLSHFTETPLPSILIPPSSPRPCNVDSLKIATTLAAGRDAAFLEDL